MMEIILIKNCVLIFFSILFFILIRYLILSKKRRENRIVKKMILPMDERLKGKRYGYFTYDWITDFLTENGVDFIYQSKATPFDFILLKVGIGFLTALISLLVCPVLICIPIGIVGFFMPDIVIFYSNKSDNQQMLPDIKKIYDIIKVQTTAGVYLTESLSECYLVVKSDRLKAALLQMNNEIIAKKSVEEAVSNFNRQFHNSYIDTFCVIMKQSLISGKKIQILEDITANINNVQSAIYYMDKEKMDRQIQVLELMIYIALMVICIFGISADVMSAIEYF